MEVEPPQPAVEPLNVPRHTYAAAGGEYNSPFADGGITGPFAATQDVFDKIAVLAVQLVATKVVAAVCTTNAAILSKTSRVAAKGPLLPPSAKRLLHSPPAAA